MVQVLHPPARVVAVLVSKVDGYVRCPAQYFATVVQRVPRTSLDGAANALPIRLGNAIHAVLASSIRELIDTGRFPEISIAVGQYFDRVPFLTGNFRQSEMESVRDHIAEALWNVREMLERHRLEPLSVEHTLAIPRMPVLGLDGKRATGLFLTVSGRFDLIALQRDTGTIWLPDWKTGHALPGPELFGQLPSVTLTDFLVRHVYLPRHPELSGAAIRVCHVLTISGDMVDVILTPTQLEAGKLIIRRLAHDLDAGRFEPQLNPTCPWCPVRGTCALYSADESGELSEDF